MRIKEEGQDKGRKTKMKKRIIKFHEQASTWKKDKTMYTLMIKSEKDRELFPTLLGPQHIISVLGLFFFAFPLKEGKGFRAISSHCLF